MLADEPTGAVDTATAQRILAILRQVARRFGTTVVIVTHDRTVARAVDRYVLIRDGKVAQEAVRRTPVGGLPAEGPVPEESHEELVVLDSAGRLQIPRELLERVGLGGRARVEAEEDRIIVRKP